MSSSRCHVIDLDDTLAHTTRDLRGDMKNLPHLSLVAGAYEFLNEGRCCILITCGDVGWQYQKLRHLKIAPYFRDVVVVREPAEKIMALERIVRASPLPPSRIVVIGDRLDMEIFAGNILGCTTVRLHLPEGKYFNQESAPEQIPDYAARDFHAVRALFPVD